MFNKDKQLKEGLVLVWGNDYQKTQNPISKEKYINNFNELLNIYRQEYKNELEKLNTSSNELTSEKERLKNLIEAKEKYSNLENKMKENYLNIVGNDYIVDSVSDEIDLDATKEKLKVIKQYLNNLEKLNELRKSNDMYNKKLLDINEELIQSETENLNQEEELAKYFDQNFAIPFDDEENYNLRTKIISIYDERIDVLEELINKTENQEKEEELSKIKFENFNLKNQLMLYDIKKILEKKEKTYTELKNKRDEIIKTLSQRERLIKTYAFQVYSDDYIEFVETIKNQIENLQTQKEKIEEKEKQEECLKNNIAEIEKIEKENNQGKILELRKNFNLITEDYNESHKEEKISFDENFDLDEFIKNNSKEKQEEKYDEKNLPPSLEEDLLKEEQNLEQILEELDIKLNQISKPKKEQVKENVAKKEEIPNIEDVINELKKQYPTDLPKEKEEIEEERKLTPSNEEIKEKTSIEKNENNFHTALDSITDDIEEKEDEKDSFLFTPEDDNSLLSILSNNDSNQLDFLNGDALDNILNNNVYKNEEE